MMRRPQRRYTPRREPEREGREAPAFEPAREYFRRMVAEALSQPPGTDPVLDAIRRAELVRP